MKTIRLFTLLLPFFIFQQANALIFVSSLQDGICVPNFDDNGIVFVGEYLQRTEIVQEQSNGETYTIYLAQYKVDDPWCGEVRTEFTPAADAPEWAATVQNTETEIWLVIQPYDNDWEEPELNQRQFITGRIYFDAIYYLSNNQSTPESYSNLPIDISDDDMISGFLTDWQMDETMSLSDFKAALSNCSDCINSSGIEDYPIEFGLFPNPVRDEINIQSRALHSNIEYSIYSTDGKQVQSGQLAEDFKVDVAALGTGLYFMSVRNADGRRGTVEFLKE